MKKMFFLVLAALMVGCMQQKDFSYGANQVSMLNSRYNVTMETYPPTIQQISSMLNELSELRSLKLNSGQEPFDYLVDYKMLNLEAERFYIQGQKYDSSGTTKGGFGCKQRPLITESVFFRNLSALKGFEAVDLLDKLVSKYPEEAKSVGLSGKNSKFLNATFYQIQREAKSDSGVINNFCPESRVLELYKEEFRKKGSYSEDYINSLDYETAVKIWKQGRGIE